MVRTPATRALHVASPAMVAEHAGVSTATVSLVANGKSAGRVSAVNEQRVREAIRELGYFVDSIGSSLAKGVSSLVVLVAPRSPTRSSPSGYRPGAGLIWPATTSCCFRSPTQASPPAPVKPGRSWAFARQACWSTPRVSDSSEENFQQPSAGSPGCSGHRSSDSSGEYGCCPGCSREVVAHFAAQGHTKAAYLDAQHRHRNLGRARVKLSWRPEPNTGSRCCHLLLPAR